MKLINYIQGKRRGKEANKLEREAMNDPFLEDAIDGFDAVPGDHLSAIQELENRLQQTKNKQKRAINYRMWVMGVAASVALIVGMRTLFVEIQKPENTAFRAPKTVVFPPKDTIDALNQNIEPTKKVVAQHIEKQKPIQASKNGESAISTSEKNPSVSVADSKSFTNASPEIAETKDELKSDAELTPLNMKPERADNGSKDRMAELTLRGVSSIPQYAVSDTPIHVNQQNGKITGKVVDAKGDPVMGAVVKIKGKKTSVLTDKSGDFELPATIGKDKLEASYIGYDKKEIQVQADSTIIRMNESQLALNEVVVVGYGSQKKVSVTGAVTAYRNENKAFGEKEFRKYYDQHRSQNICTDSVAGIRVNFFIDTSGTPTNLIVQKSTCEVLTNEFTRLLKNSPKWTTPNRKVEMTIELK